MTTERRRSASSDRSPLFGLVSPDVGIVHRIDDGLTAWDHPRLATVYTQVCDTRPVFAVEQAARAGGVGPQLPAARLGALGEAVERYSACHVPRSRLRLASAAELAPAPLAPPAWLAGAAAERRVHWVPGVRLRPAGVGEPAWVAASRAYLAAVDDLTDVIVPTSTGLACHTDPWRALRSGLLESIERDAVMTSWLTRTPARTLNTSLCWRAAPGQWVRFDRAVETYRLYLLDSPIGIPVVFGVAFGGPGQPAAAVGAAADPDLARAGRRALVEAHQTMQLATHMYARGQQAPAHPADVVELDDHVGYYLDPRRRSAFEFLDAGARPPMDVDLEAVGEGDDPARDVCALVERADAAGLSCFAVDVTSPDVRAAGLWVVRAVVPGLLPLLVGTQHVPAHPRLPAGTVLNPEPHPFP